MNDGMTQEYHQGKALGHLLDRRNIMRIALIVADSLGIVPKTKAYWEFLLGCYSGLAEKGKN